VFPQFFSGENQQWYSQNNNQSVDCQNRAGAPIGYNSTITVVASAVDLFHQMNIHPAHTMQRLGANDAHIYHHYDIKL
jgi:hypothetical protein